MTRRNRTAGGAKTSQPTRLRTTLTLEDLEGRVVMASTLSPGTEAAFVQSLYTEALGRTGSASEVGVLVGQLQGGRTAESVAAAVITSPEHYGRRVAGFYQDTLHRAADPAGLQNFVGILQHGAGEREVLVSLLGSAEYSALHPTNADFVNHLYTDVLHRNPAPNEGNPHLDLMARGRGRSAVALGFLHSPERAQVEVNELFRTYLGRDADAASLTTMAGAITAGRMTLDQLAITIATSPENLGQAAGSTGTSGSAGSTGSASSPGQSQGQGTSQETTAPRVVGAISLGNTTVRVVFSEPMADAAANPANFAVAQANVNPEAGYVAVTGAAFVAGSNNTVVDLTTGSQNEVTYAVTAVGVTDRAGNPLAPAVLAGGQRIDPASATFRGTPPTGSQLVDSDGDGLSDNVEQRGWTVAVKLVDGRTETRQVTSDPHRADTDGDGLGDAQEKNLGIDPRSTDTDDDQLTDYAEFNEVYSDPTKQDTDGDALDDFLEFTFFHTSPVFADTDGDQLTDGDEVVGSRNPRVADLPAPNIEVGQVNLQLDVRFTATSSAGSRNLEDRSVTASLDQTKSSEHKTTNSFTNEVMAKLSVGTAYTAQASLLASGVRFHNSVSVEAADTFTYNYTAESTSAAETRSGYESSLGTQKEVTAGEEVARTVEGAKIQVTVSLGNASNLAYRVQHLQVTAFIVDPQDPTKLTPVATLLPDSEPATGFTLGPLVAARGPFIFTSDTIFPQQVESLMANPRGLVFKIANYDITDELGRNFAFTSQDVVDRTGTVVLDFGDRTEYAHVAANTGRVIDTNGDGAITAADRAVGFDASGRPVGVTLTQAFQALGLTRYDETTTPTATLTADQLKNSYSTIRDAAGVKRIWRVRELAHEEGLAKTWEVITATGIDQTKGPDDVILMPGGGVNLAFVQDLDGDRVPASVEYLLGTSDRKKDTDGDHLDDRFEALIGWTVDLGPLGARKVFASGSLADSDGDGLSDTEEAPRKLTFDSHGLITGATRADDRDFVTDPLNSDTDGDGIGDAEEVNGYKITLRNPSGSRSEITVKTNPANPDTDGDSVSDSTERRLGGNPTDPTDRDRFADDDRDGLANIEETDGWNIVAFDASTSPLQQGTFRLIHVTSDPRVADTDGDGLTDGEEFKLLLNAASRDTDGDGLTDFQEVRGFTPRMPSLGILTTAANDADTDNDMLSDGAEAELTDVEANRWVVRPASGSPYRAYSNPTVADADFDGLVDGTERNLGTDPNNGNTDGDARNDGVEVAAGTNPLAVDVRVTVVAESFETSAGQFEYKLEVRKPDPTGVAGLSRNPTVVVSNSTTDAVTVGAVQVHNAATGAYAAQVFYRYKDAAGVFHDTDKEDNLDVGKTKTYNPYRKGVPVGAHFFVVVHAVAGDDDQSSQELIYQDNGAVAKFNSDGSSFNHNTNFEGVTGTFGESGQAVSLGVPDGGHFSIEGHVTNLTTNQTVQLGGIAGIKAKKDSDGASTTVRTVFSYADVSQAFIDEFYFETTVGGETVTLRFYYIVG